MILEDFYFGTGESLIKMSQAQVQVFALLQIWGFIDHQDYIVFTRKDSHEMATISQAWKWSEQVTNEIRTASSLIYQLTTKLEIYNVSIAVQLSRVGFKCI